MASNVEYDFEKYGDFTIVNMSVDEEDWAVIARTALEMSRAALHLE